MNTTTNLLPEEFVRHASLRGGIFTSEMSRKLGLSETELRNALTQKACHRVRPGLYSLDTELDVRALAWAGLHIAGPESSLGGDIAAHIRGQGPAPDVIDIYTGYRRLKSRGEWKFHPGEPDDADSPEAIAEMLRRLASIEGNVADEARELSEQVLRLLEREALLDLAEHDRLPNHSILTTRFLQRVALPHELTSPRWSASGRPGIAVGTWDARRLRLFVDFTPRRSNFWDRPSRYLNMAEEFMEVRTTWDELDSAPCHVARLLFHALQPHHSVAGGTCEGCRMHDFNSRPHDGFPRSIEEWR